MATEIARIDVQPGSGRAFEQGAAQAVALFAGAAGCRGMRLLPSHEVQERYWLFVEWDSVAAHEAFRETPAFAEWRTLVGGFFVEKPVVEHGLDIGIGFSRAG